MTSDHFYIGEKEYNISYSSTYLNQLNPRKFYYDFYIAELVGYIPASFILENKTKRHRARLSDFGRTAILLIRQAFEEFNKMQINTIESDLELDFSHFKLLMKENGFKYLDSEKMIARLPLDQISSPYKTKFGDKRIRKYEIYCDKENESIIDKLIEFLLLHENIGEKELMTFFTYLYTSDHILVSHITVCFEDKIVGNGLLLKSRWDPRTAFLSFLHAKTGDCEFIEHLIMSEILDRAMEHEILSIEVHLRDDVYDLNQKYERYGFVFTSFSTFSKI